MKDSGTDTARGMSMHVMSNPMNASTITAVDDPDVLGCAFGQTDDSRAIVDVGHDRMVGGIDGCVEALGGTMPISSASLAADAEDEVHTSIVRWLRQVSGAGAVRLPDGRIFACGGEPTETAALKRSTAQQQQQQQPSLSTTAASLRCALLRPSFSIDYASETSPTNRAHGLSHPTCGPLRWTNPISSEECAGLGRGENTLPPALSWHSVVALSDLRVIVFGGRTSARDASCVNSLWVADFASWVEPAEREVLIKETSALPLDATTTIVDAQRPKKGASAASAASSMPLTFLPLFTPVEHRSSRNEVTLLHQTSAESAATSSPSSEAMRLLRERGGRPTSSGPLPCPRHGHAAVVLRQDPALVMICGGTNSRGEALDDVYLLSVAPVAAATTPSSGAKSTSAAFRWHCLSGPRRSSVSKGGASSSAGATLGWTHLPSPASHHHVLILPECNPVSSAATAALSPKRLLLIVDGRMLFESVVYLSSPTDSATDGGIASSTPWRNLPGGGLYRSVPSRRGSAVALLSPTEVLVHGGWRVGRTTAPPLARMSLLSAHRSNSSGSGIGGGSGGTSRVALDAAFVYSLDDFSWGYRRGLTNNLSYRAGHHFVPLTTTRLHDVPGIHYLVLGGATFCDDESFELLSESGYPPGRHLSNVDEKQSLPGWKGMSILSSRFLSKSEPSTTSASVLLTPAEGASGTLGARLCSAVVSRSGLVDLGYLDDTAASYLRHDALHETTDDVIAAKRERDASQESRVARLSATPAPTEWREPSLVMRDEVLRKEGETARYRLREHLCNALLLHGIVARSDEEICATYFRRWMAHVLDVRSAAKATWMCLQCNAVPCEQRLLPCHHFVLCGSCAAMVERCPTCAVEVSGTEAGFRGHAFPALHRFLAAWQREQIVAPTEAEERNRPSDCDKVPRDADGAPSDEMRCASTGSAAESPQLALSSVQFSSPVSRSTSAFDYQALLAFNAKGSSVGGARTPKPLSSSATMWHPPPLVVRMRARKSIAVAGPMIL